MSDKDTIYRQDAIDAIMSEPPDAHYPSWYADILWKLPSAEPRKKGKWIYYDPNGFKCSKCGRYLEIGCGDVKMNFCPNCGCQMNGGEEDD